MKTVRFHDFDCVPLSNPWLSLLVTQSVGPRIISLSLRDGDNLLAVVPDCVTRRPDGKVFHFHGGHRLWRAPEEMPGTYAIDDSPVEIVPLRNGVAVVQPPEPGTGLQKTMHISLAENRPEVTVRHELTNLGPSAVACAPWAITQFRTGGVAILPQNHGDTGLLPNRFLALWPYTDMTDAHVGWGGRYLWITAEMGSPFKIGFANRRGWMAYWLAESLFVKHAGYQAGSTYCDLGSSSECYTDDRFLELETLAPIGLLQPGGSASHVETWEVHGKVACPGSEQEIQTLADRFELP